MKKLILLLTTMILILFIILFAIFLKQTLTGKITKHVHSYTKAICNETNYCQDYEITCEDNKIINIQPITGSTVQHTLDWKDPRDKKTIDKLC